MEWPGRSAQAGKIGYERFPAIIRELYHRTARPFRTGNESLLFEMVDPAEGGLN